MSKQNPNPPMELVEQPVLWVGEVFFVPHYSKRHLWVAPGKGLETIKTTTELMELNAKIEMRPLWPRHWTAALNFPH